MENDLQQMDLKLNHLGLDHLVTPTLEEDIAYGYREQSIHFANVALDYFNKKNHTKYELVEDEDMHSKPIGYGAWFHCSFKAKDSSIEEFFAEIDRVSGTESVVTTCQILKDEKRAGCEFCTSLINHPVDGYKVGHPEDSSSEQFFGEEDKLNGSESVVTTCEVLKDEEQVGYLFGCGCDLGQHLAYNPYMSCTYQPGPYNPC